MDLQEEIQTLYLMINNQDLQESFWLVHLLGHQKRAYQDLQKRVNLAHQEEVIIQTDLKILKEKPALQEDQDKDREQITSLLLMNTDLFH